MATWWAYWMRIKLINSWKSRLRPMAQRLNLKKWLFFCKQLIIPGNGNLWQNIVGSYARIFIACRF
jgi:hypothetical protein